MSSSCPTALRPQLGGSSLVHRPNQIHQEWRLFLTQQFSVQLLGLASNSWECLQQDSLLLSMFWCVWGKVESRHSLFPSCPLPSLPAKKRGRPVVSPRARFLCGRLIRSQAGLGCSSFSASWTWVGRCPGSTLFFFLILLRTYHTLPLEFKTVAQNPLI